MCVICEGEYSIDDTELDCSNCPQLTTIPATLTNLTRLDCSNCPQLTTIPATLTNFIYLDCSSCPQLTTIPATLTNFTYLDCDNCPQLIQIKAKPILYPVAYRLPKTQSFISYCYHPQRVGGYLAKRDLALLFYS